MKIKKINFSSIKKEILENWQLKVISFFLALIFWVYITL